MAKQVISMQKGVAQFSGYVDSVQHIGENQYGRTGDWIDIAVFGGIVRVEALRAVNVDDQVIVRGLLRNHGRVIDFVTQDIIVCTTEQELEAWSQHMDANYRAFLKLDLSSYDRVSITNKAVPRFSARFSGVGIQFGVSLEQEQYLAIKQFNGESLDWSFDLVRDFRVTGSEGSRQQVDTWSLRNPRPLIKRSAKVSPAEVSSSAVK